MILGKEENNFMTDSELKYKLGEKLQKIAEILCCSLNKFDCNGILAGNSGLILFMYYYSRYTNNLKYAKIGRQSLYKAIDIINKQDFTYTYCSGMSGLAWTCEHLAKYEFIDYNDIYFFKNIASYLLLKMQVDFNKGNYDFLHGGLGIGYYFINRKNSHTAITSLLKSLEDTAEKMPDCSLKWKSILNSETKQYGYNICLSHGMSSIVACITKLIVQYPDFTNKAKYILSGVVKYILKQQFSAPNISYFPSFSLEDKTDAIYSRLGWCYGDLGIAQALLQASNVLNNHELKNIALKILIHNCSRKELRKNAVIDAGICHGTVGIAYIFHRLFVNTKNDVFYETARYWFQKTLDIAQFENGLAGYKKWKGSKNNGDWENSYVLLDGIVGIGLCIMSYLKPHLMNWDECILLN
jgi:lantibiotic modifying enzyme